MKDVFYNWIRNMVFYQLLTSIVIHVIPSDTYQKYIRFFLGMLFIMIAVSPLLEIFHLADDMDMQYAREMFEQEIEENSLRFDVEEIYSENEENQ